MVEDFNDPTFLSQAVSSRVHRSNSTDLLRMHYTPPTHLSNQHL